MILSDEQLKIIELLKNSNIMVDAVAGSGKTTTSLNIAKKYNDLNILILTYNARLKNETRAKIKLNNIINLEVHSYHSFCVKYYDHGAFTDKKIREIIKLNLESKSTKFSYDIIIIDECQDMTPLYYSLVKKIIKTCKSPPRLCVLGDKFQSIYDFNEADNRFLLYANKIFYPKSNKKWVKCPLSYSYRLTKNIADFVNYCMIKEQRIKTVKNNDYKPDYVICNVFDNKPLEIVEKYLERGFQPDDFFILAPSIKSVKSPVRQLENEIKRKYDIPIYVPNSEEEVITNSIIENKMVISTFHQTKGLERKIVLVFNFDDSYFKYYKKNNNSLLCCNELYVAATRASEHLVLFHHYENWFMDFLDVNELSKYTNLEFEVDKYTFFKKNKREVKKNDDTFKLKTSPTNLIKHLPSSVIDKCMDFFKVVKIRESNTNKINIPTTISNKKNKTNENISDINGTAIPLYFEYLIKKYIRISDYIPENENITLYNNNLNLIKQNHQQEQKSIIHGFEIEQDGPVMSINEIINSISKKKLKINQLLYLTNRWLSFTNGYLYKIKQIEKEDYNWLTKEMLNEAINNLKSLNMSNNIIFENKLILSIDNIIMCGFVDCIDLNNKIVYEFKCVDKIDDSHFIQLAIYALMINNVNMKYYLYNILNNEMYEIIFDINDLEEMIKYIIKKKYEIKEKKSDKIFISNCLKNKI